MTLCHFPPCKVYLCVKPNKKMTKLLNQEWHVKFFFWFLKLFSMYHFIKALFFLLLLHRHCILFNIMDEDLQWVNKLPLKSLFFTVFLHESVINRATLYFSIVIIDDINLLNICILKYFHYFNYTILIYLSNLL